LNTDFNAALTDK